MDDHRIRHLPFLDGVRAVSIAMVIAWHARGPATAHYALLFQAWVGVDAFFVVSGFLITSLLVQERQDTGAFSFKNFYARRFLRIFPAYAVFLGVVLLYYGRAALRPVAMAAVYLNNYDHELDWGFYSSYPGGLHAIAPTWSLAIEEQFYLFWPLVLAWSGRRDDATPDAFPRALKLALAAVAAIVLWKAALLIHDPTIDSVRLYYPFETRGDAVLIGCAAALAWANPRLRERIRAGLAGLWTPVIVVVAAVFAAQGARAQDEKWLVNRVLCWAVALPVFSTLVATLILALVLHPSSAPARALSRPWMRWIGRLSYSIYLWHVFSLEETKPVGDRIARALPSASPAIVELLTDGVALTLALALACVSYYVVEKPFLRLKGRFNTAAEAPGARGVPAT